ncbi:hypothetical protein AcV7_005467 [Taiwanofungus camphoratus]|nr:hypothetical protein AcV7_005467 [Antrodia cinnamomea]
MTAGAGLALRYGRGGNGAWRVECSSGPVQGQRPDDARRVLAGTRAAGGANHGQGDDATRATSRARTAEEWTCVVAASGRGDGSRRATVRAGGAGASRQLAVARVLPIGSCRAPGGDLDSGLAQLDRGEQRQIALAVTMPALAF